VLYCSHRARLGLAEAETAMKRVVQHRPDGKVEVRAPGSERSPARPAARSCSAGAGVICGSGVTLLGVSA